MAAAPAYLAVELGQLLLVQVGLFVDPPLVSELAENRGQVSMSHGRSEGSRPSAYVAQGPTHGTPHPDTPDTSRATVLRPCSRQVTGQDKRWARPTRPKSRVGPPTSLAATALMGPA